MKHLCLLSQSTIVDIDAAATTCPACGQEVDDHLYPWREPPLGHHERAAAIDGDTIPLRCGGCGTVSPLIAWLDRGEHCPRCGSHDADVVADA
jgi:Zn finger protein HypA/HybF involved in hydrogenase expression